MHGPTPWMMNEAMPAANGVEKDQINAQTNAMELVVFDTIERAKKVTKIVHTHSKKEDLKHSFEPE